jgi:hypothetical protein
MGMQPPQMNGNGWQEWVQQAEEWQQEVQWAV